MNKDDQYYCSLKPLTSWFDESWCMISFHPHLSSSDMEIMCLDTQRKRMRRMCNDFIDRMCKWLLDFSWCRRRRTSPLKNEAQTVSGGRRHLPCSAVGSPLSCDSVTVHQCLSHRCKQQLLRTLICSRGFGGSDTFLLIKSIPRIRCWCSLISLQLCL